MSLYAALAQTIQDECVPFPVYFHVNDKEARQDTITLYDPVSVWRRLADSILLRHQDVTHCVLHVPVKTFTNGHEKRPYNPEMDEKMLMCARIQTRFNVTMFQQSHDDKNTGYVCFVGMAMYKLCPDIRKQKLPMTIAKTGALFIGLMAIDGVFRITRLAYGMRSKCTPAERRFIYESLDQVPKNIGPMRFPTAISFAIMRFAMK